MTCRELLESVEDLALHEVEPAQAVELRRHAADCPVCASRLAEAEGLNRRLRVVRESYVPSERLRAVVAGALRNDSAAETAPPVRVVKPRFRRGLLAAAASVLAFATFLFVLTGTGPSASPVLADTFAAYDGIASRAVPLDIDTSDPKAVEEYFQTRHQFELSAPAGLPGGSFTLAGGCASRGAVTGASLPAVVYRNGGATVVLMTIDRSRFDPAKTHGGVERPSACGTFHLFERDGISALACVCMDTVHVWVGGMPPDRLLEVVQTLPDPPPSGQGMRLAVDELGCAACCARAREALDGVPGVRGISVDPRSDEVQVDPGADERGMIEALRRAGFEAKVQEKKR